MIKRRKLLHAKVPVLTIDCVYHGGLIIGGVKFTKLCHSVSRGLSTHQMVLFHGVVKIQYQQIRISVTIRPT